MNYIQKKLDDWLKENKGLSLEETKSLSEKERKVMLRESTVQRKIKKGTYFCYRTRKYQI